MYENQEECIFDFAEREAYWDIPTAMIPESFVRGAVSIPEHSTSYSDARVLLTHNAETIDLVTPGPMQETLQLQPAMRNKKEKNAVSSVLIT